MTQNVAHWTLVFPSPYQDAMRINFLAMMGFVLILKRGKSYFAILKMIYFMFRCDGVTNCDDNSDEFQCSVVEMDSSYNRYLSPPPLEGRTKIMVNISMEVHSVDNFDPIAGSFAAQFTLNLKWYDGRLDFTNLRTKPKTIDPKEFLLIWFPYFNFDNTRTKEISRVDEKSNFKVFKEGKGKLGSARELENKYIFSGNHNPISYGRFYSLEFECDFSLR